MKLLDLFCCCGGISEGFARNGFECTGVDITDNHVYPFEFIQKDVFELDIDWMRKFDVIHASPPCQAYIWSNRKKERTKHPKLIEKTRNLLQKTGKPYIIENVIGAPIRKDIMLCGEMFNGLRVIRHRKFEIERFTVLQPPHIKHKKSVINCTAVGVYSGGDPGFWGDKQKRIEFRAKKKSYYASVAGHGGDSYSFRLEDWKNAMQINWVNDKLHLTQMIPPAYSEYISRFLQTD